MIHKMGFKVSIVITLGFCLVSYINNVVMTLHNDISVAYSADSLFALSNTNSFWNIFESIFPYLIVFPFAFSFLEDINIKINPYFMHRLGKNNYFIGKTIVCFLGGFLIIFIPFLVNLGLCHITFPNNNNTFFGYYNTNNYCRTLIGSNVVTNTEQKGLPFLKLYLYSPLLYNFVYLLIASIFSGIMGMFSLSFSFFYKKSKILLFVPPFLFFYFGRLLDSVSYRSQRYINYNWMNYICVDSFYGKKLSLFLLVIFIIISFIIASLIFICRKEEL